MATASKFLSEESNVDVFLRDYRTRTVLRRAVIVTADSANKFRRRLERRAGLDWWRDRLGGALVGKELVTATAAAVRSVAAAAKFEPPGRRS